MIDAEFASMIQNHLIKLNVNLAELNTRGDERSIATLRTLEELKVHIERLPCHERGINIALLAAKMDGFVSNCERLHNVPSKCETPTLAQTLVAAIPAPKWLAAISAGLAGAAVAIGEIIKTILGKSPPTP